MRNFGRIICAPTATIESKYSSVDLEIHRHCLLKLGMSASAVPCKINCILLAKLKFSTKKKSSDIKLYLISEAICFFLFNLNLVDPAFGSFDSAHLDTCECIVKLLKNGAHFIHTAREADFLAVVNDLAYR